MTIFYIDTNFNKFESYSTANCLPLSEQESSDTSSRRVGPAVDHPLLSSNVWCADILEHHPIFVLKKIWTQ